MEIVMLRIILASDVYAHFRILLNNVGSRSSVDRRDAETCLKQFSEIIKYLRTMSGNDFANTEFLKSTRMNIESVSSKENLFYLYIDLSVYIFAVESDTVIFLKHCRRGLETNKIMLEVADMSFRKWKEKSGNLNYRYIKDNWLGGIYMADAC